MTSAATELLARLKAAVAAANVERPARRVGGDANDRAADALISKIENARAGERKPGTVCSGTGQEQIEQWEL